MKTELITLKSKRNEPVAIAIGFFDGLHLGHKTLIEEVLKHKEYTTCLLTFTRDLKKVINGKDSGLVLTDKERIQKLNECGIEKEYILPFTDEVMHTSPEDFLTFLKNLNPKVIVVGSDFRFGDQAKGDTTLLKKLSYDGIKVIIKDLLLNGKEKISTSDIKKKLENHKIKEANELLGYNFFIEGEVKHGFRNGCKIGFPTANMEYPEEKVKLPSGVYKTIVRIEDKSYLGMTNIGSHPTISPLDKDIIETHILDFDEDIYGKTIGIEFVDYLRSQVRFNSLEDLKQQLKKDLIQIRGK